MSRLRAHRASALELCGIVMLSVGAALVYFPAGLIVGGLALMFVAQGLD